MSPNTHLPLHHRLAKCGRLRIDNSRPNLLSPATSLQNQTPKWTSCPAKLGVMRMLWYVIPFNSMLLGSSPRPTEIAEPHASLPAFGTVQTIPSSSTPTCNPRLIAPSLPILSCRLELFWLRAPSPAEPAQSRTSSEQKMNHPTHLIH
jgi:hypothetical protein